MPFVKKSDKFPDFELVPRNATRALYEAYREARQMLYDLRVLPPMSALVEFSRDEK
jgi:hypothetical protein